MVLYLVGKFKYVRDCSYIWYYKDDENDKLFYVKYECEWDRTYVSA